jgi:hypothetical protein
MIDLPVSFFLKNLSEPQSQPLAGNKHFGAIRRNTPTFPVTKLPDWKPPWPKPLR